MLTEIRDYLLLKPIKLISHQDRFTIGTYVHICINTIVKKGSYFKKQADMLQNTLVKTRQFREKWNVSVSEIEQLVSDRNRVTNSILTAVAVNMSNE